MSNCFTERPQWEQWYRLDGPRWLQGVEELVHQGKLEMVVNGGVIGSSTKLPEKI